MQLFVLIALSLAPAGIASGPQDPVPRPARESDIPRCVMERILAHLKSDPDSFFLRSERVIEEMNAHLRENEPHLPIVLSERAALNPPRPTSDKNPTWRTAIAGPESQISVRWNLPHWEHEGVVEIDVEQTHFPFAALIGERWVSQSGKILRFINVGDRPTAVDRPFLDRAFELAQSGNPLQEVNLLIGGARGRGNQWRSETERLILERVLESYDARKRYLGEQGLRALRNHQAFAKNYDTWALVDSEVADVTQLTPEQIGAATLVTLRLVRFERHDYSLPTRLDAVSRNASPYQELPHFARPASLTHYHQSMLEVEKMAAQGKRIAEISRYARLGQVPPDADAAFLLNVMNEAQKPGSGLDILLASVDRATRRLFGRKFRFQDVRELENAQNPSEENEHPEYLMMLEVGSDAFRRTHADLTAQAQGLLRQDLSNSLPN